MVTRVLIDLGVVAVVFGGLVTYSMCRISGLCSREEERLGLEG